MNNVKIGETVYIIFKNSINKEKVYLIGEESFCHERAFNGSFLATYRSPLRYDEEGTRWFRTLKEAKEQLKKISGCDRIVKHDDDYWEVE